MGKKEYLAELRGRLKALPENERQDAVGYYEGYLDDAGKGAKKAMEELGTPSEVAAKILAEFSMKEKSTGTKKERQNFKITLCVILGVFAAPVALPVAIAVAAVAFALLVTLVALVVAFGASGAAMIVAGIVYLPLTIIISMQSAATGIATLGAGLIVLGLGMLLTRGTVVLARLGYGWIAKFASKTILKKETK